MHPTLPLGVSESSSPTIYGRWNTLSSHYKSLKHPPVPLSTTEAPSCTIMSLKHPPVPLCHWSILSYHYKSRKHPPLPLVVSESPSPTMKRLLKHLPLPFRVTEAPSSLPSGLLLTCGSTCESPRQDQLFVDDPWWEVPDGDAVMEGGSNGRDSGKLFSIQIPPRVEGGGRKIMWGGREGGRRREEGRLWGRGRGGIIINLFM